MRRQERQMNTAIEANQLHTDRIPPESSPLAELIGRLSDDLKLLTRQEAELAKRELSESLHEAKRQAAQLAVGGGAFLAGLLVLLAAAVLALATVIPAWSAALVVGGVVSLLGLMLVLAGKSKLSRVNFKPEQTLKSVERDISAIKQAAK
jgi:predicted phage tail protein